MGAVRLEWGRAHCASFAVGPSKVPQIVLHSTSFLAQPTGWTIGQSTTAPITTDCNDFTSTTGYSGTMWNGTFVDSPCTTYLPVVCCD